MCSTPSGLAALHWELSGSVSPQQVPARSLLSYLAKGLSLRLPSINACAAATASASSCENNKDMTEGCLPEDVLDN